MVGSHTHDHSTTINIKKKRSTTTSRSSSGKSGSSKSTSHSTSNTSTKRRNSRDGVVAAIKATNHKPSSTSTGTSIPQARRGSMSKSGTKSNVMTSSKKDVVMGSTATPSSQQQQPKSIFKNSNKNKSEEPNHHAPTETTMKVISSSSSSSSSSSDSCGSGNKNNNNNNSTTVNGNTSSNVNSNGRTNSNKKNRSSTKRKGFHSYSTSRFGIEAGHNILRRHSNKGSGVQVGGAAGGGVANGNESDSTTVESGHESHGHNGDGDHSNNGGYSGDQEYKNVERMAQAETSRIRVCRIIVVALILVTGLLVSIGCYLFLSNQEYENYIHGYYTFTKTIEDTSQFYVTNMYDAVSDIGETITLSANKSQSKFPFVTVEYFESRGRHARDQSGFLDLLWLPLVQEWEADAWANYSVTHSDWIQSSRDVAIATFEVVPGYGTDNSVQQSIPSAADYKSAHITPFIYDAFVKDVHYHSDNDVSSTEDEEDGDHHKDHDHRTLFALDDHQPSRALGFGEHDDDAASIAHAEHKASETEEEHASHYHHFPVVYGGPYLPIWEISPPPIDGSPINKEMLHYEYLSKAFQAVVTVREAVFTKTVDLADLPASLTGDAQHLATHQAYTTATTNEEAFEHPHSAMIEPVFSELGRKPDDLIVGVVQGTIVWDRYLVNLLPDGVSGLYCVLSNTCGEVYTYRLDGAKATFLGKGDLHETAFDDTAYVILLEHFKYPNVTMSAAGHCIYSFTTYSSSEYLQSTTSNTAVAFTVGVAIVFFAVAITFLVYDIFVQQRNNKVIKAAARANSILSSLFPKNVRDRLFKDKEEEEKNRLRNSYAAPKSHLNNFLKDNNSGDADNDNEFEIIHDNKPIADLFTETTVMYADIAGFTAWSSVREPAQVFILLETVYHAFDVIAHRRRVFKVETVGDCYVAVTGLPDPRKDHAVAMCRFARDCIFKFRYLVKKLEVTLGPDTGELDLRVGLHSGSVTAGVLRGDRSRFQLFGDTMNIAARMESTSHKGKIQISDDTAVLLMDGGKEKWITERDERVNIKGKGEVRTYWFKIGHEKSKSADKTSNTESEPEEVTSSQPSEEVEKEQLDLAAEKMLRLVDWNAEVLLRLLKLIVARRNASKSAHGPPPEPPREDEISDAGQMTLDEVKEIIRLPRFDADAARSQEDINDVQLQPQVVEQLYKFVQSVAQTYNNNPFHNFEHASHVCMSVNKLLSRIVAPDIEYNEEDEVQNEAALHDHTYGITSDPLTQFACVFSSLIHDADHSGVPNAQLVKEGAYIAKFYNGRSVAEQNSVDLCWQLLMEDDYKELRATIYTTQDEFRRFRQLVVNAVMATDIVDKDMKMMRNMRWNKAFSEEKADENPRDTVNRKATIVIEHLMQASDIAHTMQHWHVYRKWNERFFLECTKAFREGRAEKDPAEFWYQGEIGFFDFYIIPLARKLKDCGVFGVSSDEYLNYAVRNRQEWEQRGCEVVDEMIELANKKGARESRQKGQTAIEGTPQQMKCAASPA